MSLSAFDIEIAETIKRFIEKDIQVHHTPAFLADRAGMSENKLNQIFKQVAKTTLYAYLKNKRMVLAATLLEGGSKQLKQICKIAGFKNYSNFSRAFKKHYGVPPGRYRKLYKV